MAEPEKAKAALPVVLLVDDEPLLLEALGPELRGTCKLFTASSAAEADLRLAARRYDALVLCRPDFPFVQDGTRRDGDFRDRQSAGICGNDRAGLADGLNFFQ